jgi:hypothetical protein
MEEELDDIETRLEVSPKKSLCLLALQCGLAKVRLMLSQSCYSCGLTKLQSYVICIILPSDCNTRIPYCILFQESVFIWTSWPRT